jgi:hypothetical protein
MPDDDTVSVLPIEDADRCVVASSSSLELASASPYAGPVLDMPSFRSKVTPFPRTSVRTARFRTSVGAVLRPTIVWRPSVLIVQLRSLSSVGGSGARYGGGMSAGRLQRERGLMSLRSAEASGRLGYHMHLLNVALAGRPPSDANSPLTLITALPREHPP